MSGTSQSLIEAGLRAPHEPSVKSSCIRDVVDSHDTRGWNYAWLSSKLGKVLWADHREPAERITQKQGKPSAEWRTYSSWAWERHGAVVNHDPKHLVKEHVDYYVDPEKRKIDLRFYMQLPSGFVYVTFPIRRFYELERDWFIKHGLCSKPVTKHEADHIDALQSAAYGLKGLAPFIPAEKVMLNMQPTPQIALQTLEESLAKMGIAVGYRRRGTSQRSRPKAGGFQASRLFSRFSTPGFHPHHRRFLQ